MRVSDTESEFSIVDLADNSERNAFHIGILNNARKAGLRLSDDHFQVIDALIDYYRRLHTTGNRMQPPHRQMQFLVERFADKGGRHYLQQLFNQGETSYGVLHAILGLAGLHQCWCDIGKNGEDRALDGLHVIQKGARSA